MLTVKEIRPDVEGYAQAKALYEAAFPANERRDFDPLVTDTTGHGETLGFFDGEQFVGFASLLLVRDIAHIVYFATLEELRGKGYGTQALQLMHRRHAGKRVIVDLELERDGAPNNEQRRRRRAFYVRNGYSPTKIRYDWRGDDYEILSFGGNVSRFEFGRFYMTLHRETEHLAEY